ncbi:unnamed protein product [Dimorphilus gyrociliatus]|uniref:Uncharacterized protein n=1 Tax=Dimorphilus gyrociliatus TaxID=2664684 RepID=A0A7I8VPS6_9ANNE|nr:unnamed protein product [Dimorphilus gyrociliatus]
MIRWVAKTIAAIAGFMITIAFTFLPFKLKNIFIRKGTTGKAVLSCLSCFSGGVFFGTFILHMLPEVNLILDEALLRPRHITYPVAETIIALGFFLVLYTEKIAIMLHYKKSFHKIEKCDTDKQTNDKIMNSNVESKSVDKAQFALLNGSLQPENGSETNINIQLDEPHEMRSVLLMVALSLHRIFEGLSIGLKSTVFGVWSLFLAVMCHEIVIAFSLGMHLANVKTKRTKLIVAVIFCCLVGPLGVVIGTLITELGTLSNTVNIINGVLQGIATGTFIYVTFFEILNEELEKSVSIINMICLFVGFATMAALGFIPENSIEESIINNSTSII